MAITVDSTVGGAAANSFVSAAEADAYLVSRLNAGAWNDETDADVQAAALIEATRELSAMAWDGSRASETQALAWPRSAVTNPDGIGNNACYAITVVPQRIKDATCELALEFLRAGTSDIAGADTNAGVIRKVVDVLETDWQPGQRPQGLARFPRVQHLVTPLLGVGTGQVRLVR